MDRGIPLRNSPSVHHELVLLANNKIIVWVFTRKCNIIRNTTHSGWGGSPWLLEQGAGATGRENRLLMRTCFSAELSSAVSGEDTNIMTYDKRSAFIEHLYPKRSTIDASYSRKKQLSAMQGTNQLVRRNQELGLSLRDILTHPWGNRTSNLPPARQSLLHPVPMSAPISPFIEYFHVNIT